MGTIKSFKKFIEESIWSDIQDRSAGEVVRKEDDVNLLDLNEFYNYIKDQYKTKVEYIDLEAMGVRNEDVLGVDITENVILFYKPKRGHIVLSWSRVKIPMPFFDELADRFKIENTAAMRRIITEKDGSCTNKTFVDAIEFFLGHKESMMNESIWSDIQDRSAGEITRKEDSVNLMDKAEFFEYIKSHYKVIIDCEEPGYGSAYIRYPLFVYPRKVRYVLFSTYSHRIMVRTPYIEVWPDNLLDIIKTKYKREDTIDKNRDHMTYISPKEGEGNNEFFLDFIDTILANVDKPALKKKVLNESIWSDLQDRSSGETIRKEDERHKILERLLATYIKLFAESCYYHDEYTSGSYPDFRAYIKDFRDNPRIEEVCPDDSYFDDLLNYVNKETWNDQIIETIMEMTDRLDKGEHHLITDDVIEELRKHSVNESIWSDIQDRSSGDTIRKEDEYDIDENELERGVEVSVRRYVIQSIYSDYYDGSSDTFLKCIQEWDKNICTNVQLYDRRVRKYVEPIKVIPSYIKKNWETGKSYKSLVEKAISEEEKKVKDTGFVKKPGESIRDTLSKWFDKNADIIGEDYCEEIEEHNAEYHNEGGSRYIDLGVEEWWDDLKYIEQIEIYQEYMKKTNESIWSDIQDRSAGDSIRKEDDINLLDGEGLYEYIKEHYNIHPEAYIDYDDCLDTLSVSLFTYNTSTKFNEQSIYYGILDDVIYVSGNELHPEFKKILEDNYNLVKNAEEQFEDYFYNIQPKDNSKINNALFISIIDYVLEQIKNISVVPLMKKKDNVNESIWSDIQDRSAGETVREEDELTEKDRNDLDKLITLYANEVVYGRGMGTEACNLDGFCDYIETDNEIGDLNKDKILQYVKDYWADEVCDSVDGAIEQAQSEYHQDMNESIWSDIQDRSTGETIRKEDEVLSDMEIDALNEFARMYCRRERGRYIQNKMVPPLPSHRKENDYERFIKYIEDRRNENLFTNVGDYNKIIRFIKNNWDKLNMDKYIKGHIFSSTLMNGKKLVECEGVPGGVTPGDIGGMGPAYFPGPNGEPGSGDLPSPTGVVYHQVAPYTMFLKGMKKKKKKKKFRIEDEPCAHSENPPIYSHVDDFRDYVDRTYNNIDRRK